MYSTIERIIVLALLLLYAGAADAYGSLRCKGQLISVGASAAEVLKLCGEPKERLVTQTPVRAGMASGFTRFLGFASTETWVYDRGWGKFPVILYIDAGKIQRIEYLPQRSSGH